MDNNNTIIYKCLDCGFIFEEYDYHRVYQCNDCGSMNLSTDISDEEYSQFLNNMDI